MLLLRPFGILLLLNVLYNEAKSSEIQLPLLTLRGKELSSRNGVRYEAYLGIPYGEVRERFGTAHPVTSLWNGTKDATEFGSHCAQPSLAGEKIMVGAEDCLFLNIYTQAAEKPRKRPVLFYIHGGGFTYGTGAVFGGDYLMDEDIVLVTVNYRLGILGFLNTGNGDAPGNMGLKDQLLALQWVHENIEYFGGDSSKVTIGGASAGSASVIYMILSPVAKGLFHNAIAFSGSPLNPWAYTRDSRPQAEKVGKYLNCEGDGSRSFLDCLREKPIEEIMKAQASLKEWFMEPMVPFPPTLEMKDPSNPVPFLEASPAELLAAGRFTRVPVLTTINKDEGVTIYSGVVLRTEGMRKELDEEFHRVAPITFGYRNEELLGRSGGLESLSSEIRHFYFGNKKIDLESADNLTNLYTDTWFMCGIHEMALHLGISMPVYTGLFAHVSEHFSLTRNFGIQEILGVGHGDEASYIFNPAIHDAPIRILFDLTGPKDVSFSREIVKVVAHFAEYSVPNTSEFPNWNPISSEEIESKSLNWLALDLGSNLLMRPFSNRIEFWDKLHNSMARERDEL